MKLQVKLMRVTESDILSMYTIDFDILYGIQQNILQKTFASVNIFP